LQVWITPLQVWITPLQVWFMPLQDWFTSLQVWFTPLQVWFTPLQVWITPLQVWFAPLQVWFTVRLGPLGEGGEMVPLQVCFALSMFVDAPAKWTAHVLGCICYSTRVFAPGVGAEAGTSHRPCVGQPAKASFSAT